jgi:hypothetical protein
MKRISISILLLNFFVLIAHAQELKKEEKATPTKIEAFTSKTGSIIKFQDSKLSYIKTKYADPVETRIRKVIVGPETKFFYQIDKSGKYDSHSIASIEYSDLLEVIKAMSVLKADVEKDIAQLPDYIENKFVTSDGFAIGYYVSGGKAVWYLKLEKYGSDNTIFLGDNVALDTELKNAKSKIDELKK